jgi:sulfite reductase (ferredoxin)
VSDHASEPTRWNDLLDGRIDPAWAAEIDEFEAQMQLRKQGRLDETVFAETRLRRGAYGQRYDNGRRYDGYATRELPLDTSVPTKGAETLWDAPGMQRIKLPFGGFSPEQLEATADCAEEYADGILHITTRQDVQLHYVHLEDTPDLMRRLAAVGITTREACGNSIRNVTACPLAGTEHEEAFDVSPYARALMEFLLGHPDVQDFGRKFKPAFSCNEDDACGLAYIHDAGYIAKLDEQGRKGFKVVVGGGLGTVPHKAVVLSEFTPVEEFLKETQAVSRVFARLGEKKNRNRARLKFLVAKLGIDEFRRLVAEELETIPHDPRHLALVGDDLPAVVADGLGPARPLDPSNPLPEGYAEWARTNVTAQRQEGYRVVTIPLPLGDCTADQARAVADLARAFCGDNVRTSVEQDLVLRFVSEADLPALYQGLVDHGLHLPGANTMKNVTACPGTDTCKLGIASSRGLAGVLRERLAGRELPQAVEPLAVKVSGCFNSCAQHHIADIGFYGNSRGVDGRRVPHFQVVLGGRRTHNADTFGMGIGAVPSKNAPAVLDAITEEFLASRQDGEEFHDWTQRLGKRGLRAIVEPFMEVPRFEDQPDFYVDNGDARPYSIGDLGVGECAGEVVSLFGIEVVRAEAEVFEAQVALDEKRFDEAEAHAYRAMLLGARALVRTEFIDVTEDPDDIVAQWKTRFFDTELFFDRFAKGKFGRHLLDRHEDPSPSGDPATAARHVEEAQLFVEACHSCDAKVVARKTAIVEVSA